MMKVTECCKNVICAAESKFKTSIRGIQQQLVFPEITLWLFRIVYKLLCQQFSWYHFFDR